MPPSHCRSDQLDQPDHRNSQTTLDQKLESSRYTISTRQLPDFTRPRHDSSRPLFDYNQISIPISARLFRLKLDPYTILTRVTQLPRPLPDLSSISTRALQELYPTFTRYSHDQFDVFVQSRERLYTSI